MPALTPQQLDLAFKHAAGLHPAAAPRLQAARMRWSSTPTSGAVAHRRHAVGCACQAKVGGIYLGALGDVAEATSLEAAEAAEETPATEEDESYVSWVLGKVRAAPEQAAQIWKETSQYAPSVVAARAARDAVVTYVDAVKDAGGAAGDAARRAAQEAEAAARAAALRAESAIKAAHQDALDLGHAVKEGGEKGMNVVTALTIMTGVGMAALLVYALKH